jgi:predicted AAA+ superfamily ATPase
VVEHRNIILKGPESIYNKMDGHVLSAGKKHIIFDEIHKFRKWKNLLKGFFDLYHKSVQITVTGSARLNVYKQGGDSLMGRYFPYRMHPITVRETVSCNLPTECTQNQFPVALSTIQQLLEFGGFPEPFLRRDKRFFNRWSRLRLELLFKDDLSDLTHISDIARIKTLAQMLSNRVGGLINYSNLAGDLQVNVDTIRRWIDVLEEIYFCFRIRPYSKNISRSLLREPKIFMWDWSIVNDTGSCYENFIASHLLKLVHYLTDSGFGTFELCYLRDKDKREVDFLVIRDDLPWFLVEAKIADNSLSEHLQRFQNQLQAPHAFQVLLNLPYVDKNCFLEEKPVIVPAATFLSQLV